MADVSKRLDGIEQALATTNKQIARHGQTLDEIAKAVAPLKDLRDFVERVADNHERRITSLEKGQR